MKFSNKLFSFVVASAAVVSSFQVAAAEDVFSGCSCVTAPISNSEGVGQIISSKGDVLVNNAGASAGQILNVSSEIMVGAGSVAYKVGATCSNSTGANTIVSITQPAGPNGNLCVSALPIESGVTTNGKANEVLGALTAIGITIAAPFILPIGSDPSSN